jgi:hypothetical protein
MRRWMLLSLISLGAITLTACDSLPFFGGAETPQDEVSDLDGVPLIIDDNEEEFDEPLVPATATPTSLANVDLIQSTNPQTRADAVQTERADPFAILPVPPPPPPAEQPEAPAAQQPAAQQPTAQQPAGQQPGAPGTPTAQQPAGQQPGAPGTPTAFPEIAPLPEIPQATTAATIQVSGIVQVGNDTYAIVQAPGEPTSRYARAGQRFANGQVLLKRIEMRGGGEPVVIFEENGVELAVSISDGEGNGNGAQQAAAPAPAGQTAALTPQQAPLVTPLPL